MGWRPQGKGVFLNTCDLVFLNKELCVQCLKCGGTGDLVLRANRSQSSTFEP